MKSKAHSKKCQEMGVLASSSGELEPEEGTTEDLFQDSEGQEGSELPEHQFSDLEESDDDDDDNDEEEEEEEEDEEDEEEENQEESLGKASETKNPSLPGSSPRSSLSSQEKGTNTTLSTMEDVPSGNQSTVWCSQAASLEPEMKWSADSCEVAVCHSLLRLHRPALSSSALSTSAEKESVRRPQMRLAMDLSVSKDITLRRRCSPSKDSGVSSDGNNRSLARKHLLTKNETSPKRLSYTGEMPSSHQALRESFLLCNSSPRLEISPSRYFSSKRELSSPLHLPPARGVSPVRGGSPNREMSSSRYLSLKKMLSQSYSEPPSRYPSPAREDMSSRGQVAVDEKGQNLRKTPHGISSSVPLPHRSFDKDTELHEDPKLKTESRNPTVSPGIIQHLNFRPLLHQVPIRAPDRVEDHIFSHLPLHSQQLPRSPCPMIPIGGIQMVQARPSTHPSLGHGSVMSLQAGYFEPGGSTSEFSPVKARHKETPNRHESPPSSATSPLRCGIYVEEKTRTRELQQTPSKEGYRVKKWGSGEQESFTATPMSTCSKGEGSPKPSAHGEGPFPKKGKEYSGGSCITFKSTCTFISSLPTQSLDRSSSMGCLLEHSSSRSSPQLSARRRNLSGEPASQAGAYRRRSPSLEHAAGFGLAQSRVENSTGNT